MRYTSHFWRRPASAFLVLSFCIVNPVAADPGDPDPDFGSGGAVVMDVGADNFGDNARHVAVQCDGRIVVTGDSGYTVARFNADGTPDAGFGTAGFVLLTVNGETVSGHMSVIQRDGKIVVFGDRWSTNDPVAVRLNSDGSTDTSYGNNGVVSLDVDPGDENLWASALQADDKILVASNLQFLVLRLSKDGALDPSFGNDGVATGAGTGFNAIKLQTDGKIVGVGGFSGPFMIARLNGNGSLDTSFDMDGIVTTEALGVFGTPSGVAVRADGKIVVSGYGSAPGSGTYNEMILLRFGSNGALDTNFGNAGIVATDIAPTDDEIYDLVLDPQERILVAGQSEDYISSNPTVGVLIARYTADGALDTSFGTNGDGVVVGDGGTAWALTLQTDGKIVIGGYRGEPIRQLLVQRFLNDPASAGLVPAYCQASSGSGGNNNNGGEGGGGGGGGSIDVFSLAFAVSLLAIGGVRRRRSR
jgi:uncharacterized delta-60 repeat protein